MARKIGIIQNMSELGAGTRGASLGFPALEMAALKLGKDLFHRIPVEKIPIRNEALYLELKNPFAKYIEVILKCSEKGRDIIAKKLDSGILPFIISGDHSNALASIAAIRTSFSDKRLGVIWIDAHGDLHSPYTTPSGNMHGMPLAAALGIDNLEFRKNDPVSSTVRAWNDLKALGKKNPMLTASDVIFFGVRNTEKAEDHVMKQQKIRDFTVDELRYKGINRCLEEARKLLSGCELLYISFDVDSMDCNLVSRGTGTPVDNGLSAEEAQAIIDGFITDPRFICLEIVEINPLLDNRGNAMAETAVRILDDAIRKYEKER